MGGGREVLHHHPVCSVAVCHRELSGVYLFFFSVYGYHIDLCDNNNNENEHIFRMPFHVKHAQLC